MPMARGSLAPSLMGLWAAAGFPSGAAQGCPNGGIADHGRCWFMANQGSSCATTCAAAGLKFSWFVADATNPMTPRLLGREPGRKQGAWGRVECYVPGEDRYHPAGQAPAAGGNDDGEPGDWAYPICRLACPCSRSSGTGGFPGCVEPGVVLRHSGTHAIFIDASGHGTAGCWQNDCKNTDKFNADNMGICARMCSELDDCMYWTFGEQDGTTKCFLRKSDGGREMGEGWSSGEKACAPAPVPDALMAMRALELPALIACDGGKSQECPDMARAMMTWKFGLKHLAKATDGKLDANTAQFITQVVADTDAFMTQMSEDNFPVVVGNNRQIFNALKGWLSSQASGEVDAGDSSLPNVLRGELCGPTTCFERM